MTEFLAPLAVVAVLMAVLVAGMLIRAPAPGWVKFILVAVLTVGSTFSAHVVADRLGYAVPVPPPAKARILHYHVVMEKAQKARIELWLDQGRTRLHVIPYTKQAEKELERGTEAAKRGGVLVLRDDPKEPGLHTDILTPHQAMPKDDPVPAAPTEPQWNPRSPTT